MRRPPGVADGRIETGDCRHRVDSGWVPAEVFEDTHSHWAGIVYRRSSRDERHHQPIRGAGKSAVVEV